MEAIYIPNLLKASGRKSEIEVRDRLASFPTLTPVKGIVVVRHGGNFLEVVAKAETIVTLTCDRCLQSYNHRLAIDTSEIIWLELAIEAVEDLPAEREVSTEDLSETLPPNGYFDTESWLYEQLCLATPLRQLCSQDCQGTTQTSVGESQIDSRWSSLASLKEQLNSLGES